MVMEVEGRCENVCRVGVYKGSVHKESGCVCRVSVCMGILCKVGVYK